mmetsp:Transcript_62111/g.178716  ORF Transcript_62111/g.178716 Transcript_62111/m.178716 type:complete len:275 (+) Transcript_62111:136-960(+)|eukprot:CAMPEP_0176110612 /NCGR_PEP_ID=MMETSP0120_2-20121206/55543_1 /TAXON_ID=160619 /ORGANISM="Kryptoperidinium foliaceum, Strain CCMP 1326" /LENGTH=274 /DNA_ID=CAMNT_0017444819 /DNA_START=109 /DNA_END=933 /DNA_ORIENTATION=-
MGNSNSSSRRNKKNKQSLENIEFPNEDDPIDDFEPIDKPSSPNFLKSFEKHSNINDLATSGILVDMPPSDETSSAAALNKRRIVKAGAPKAPAPGPTKEAAVKKEEAEDAHPHDLPKTAQSDQELLEETLSKSKQERLQKLQMDHKSRRQKAIQERRQKNSAPSSNVSANPFSRFLSVFSVEPPFPSHKRPYDTEEDEGGDTSALEPKRPKLDPNYKGEGDDGRSSAQSFPLRVKDWLDAHLPAGWPWMAAVGLAATVILTSRQKQQRLTSKSS